MNISGNGLEVVQSSSGQEANRLPTSRLQIAAAAVGLAVLLVSGASRLPQSESDWSNIAAAQPRVEAQWQTEPTTLDYFPGSPERDAAPTDATAAQAGPTAFVYFPAQYENQAKEVEEHIQAF